MPEGALTEGALPARAAAAAPPSGAGPGSAPPLLHRSPALSLSGNLYDTFVFSLLDPLSHLM